MWSHSWAHFYLLSWGWSFLCINFLVLVGSTKCPCLSNSPFLILSVSPALPPSLPHLPPSPIFPRCFWVLTHPQNPSFRAHCMMSFCSPVKESTDNNHQVELDQTGEKPTFPCCHEWQRRCFVVHWARKVSEAACGKGMMQTERKGKKCGQGQQQKLGLLAFMLHGPTDLPC